MSRPGTGGGRLPGLVTEALGRREAAAPQPPSPSWGRDLARSAVSVVFATSLGFGAVASWSAAAALERLFWPSCLLGCLLLVLGMTDARRFILPDALTLPLLLSGLATAYALDPTSVPHHLLGAFSGFAFFFLFAHAYRLLRGREGLGLGDAKLMASIGAWVSWQGLPSVVLVAAAAGLAVTMAGGLLGRPVRWEDRLPFGAYLAFAAWLVWLYGPLSLGGAA